MATDNYIQVFDHALPSDFCKKIIGMFDREKITNKKSGTVYVEGKSEVTNLKQSLDFVMCPRSEEDLESFNNKDWNNMMEYLMSNSTDYQVKYIERLKGLGLDEYCKHSECFIYENILYPRTFSFPQIQKTSVGEKFDWHSDYYSNRLCTFIYYLNDVEDGGSTEFRNDKVIEAKEGRLVVFPSGWNYIHRGTAVLAGSKYVVTCFSVYAPKGN
jgi:hypothetical protein